MAIIFLWALHVFVRAYEIFRCRHGIYLIQSRTVLFFLGKEIFLVEAFRVLSDIPHVIHTFRFSLINHSFCCRMQSCESCKF